MLRWEYEYQKYLRENGITTNWLDQKASKESFQAGFEKACEQIHDQSCGCGNFVNHPWELVDEKTGKPL